MQHAIDPAQHGPRGQVMADAVQACVHCGFCLAACPTYAVLGEEMDSPRGRIVLMKGVLEGALDSAEADPHIDRCLGCLGCVPACPSGVAYGDLLTSYRAQREPQRRRPAVERAQRALLHATLPHPRRVRWAVRAGRVGRRLAPLVPNAFAGMLALLPDRLPSAPPLPALFPAHGRRRARVALLSGCVQQVLDPEINWATLRVLAANGVETVVPPGQGCCGAILQHGGAAAAARELARRNIAAFVGEFDALVTNAAGCGSGMREYGLLFAGEADAAAAGALAAQVRDITTFLDELGPVTPVGLAQPVTALYQDACHLRHAQGVAAAPRRLLGMVANLTVVESADNALCCGSAGTYNLEQPTVAAELGRRKALAVQAAGAEALISGNIGCLTQIGTHLRALGAAVPVYHTVVVLDRAYGGRSLSAEATPM